MTDQETIEGYESLIEDFNQQIEILLNRKVHAMIGMAKFKSACEKEPELFERIAAAAKPPSLYPVFKIVNSILSR